MHLPKAGVHAIAAPLGHFDEARIVAVAVDGVVHIPLRLPQGLSHVHRVQVGQLLPGLCNQVSDPQQEISPGLAVHIPPFPGLIKRGMGRGHRPVHVLRRADHHLGQFLPGGGIERRGGVSAHALGPCPVDIILAALHSYLLQWHCVPCGPRANAKGPLCPQLSQRNWAALASL